MYGEKHILLSGKMYYWVIIDITVIYVIAMELLAGCYTQCFSIVFYVLINSKSPGALDDDNCEGY